MNRILQQVAENNWNPDIDLNVVFGYFDDITLEEVSDLLTLIDDSNNIYFKMNLLKKLMSDLERYNNIKFFQQEIFDRAISFLNEDIEINGNLSNAFREEVNFFIYVAIMANLGREIDGSDEILRIAKESLSMVFNENFNADYNYEETLYLAGSFFRYTTIRRPNFEIENAAEDENLAESFVKFLVKYVDKIEYKIELSRYDAVKDFIESKLIVPSVKQRFRNILSGLYPSRIIRENPFNVDRIEQHIEIPINIEINAPVIELNDQQLDGRIGNRATFYDENKPLTVFMQNYIVPMCDGVFDVLATTSASRVDRTYVELKRAVENGENQQVITDLQNKLEADKQEFFRLLSNMDPEFKEALSDSIKASKIFKIKDGRCVFIEDEMFEKVGISVDNIVVCLDSEAQIYNKIENNFTDLEPQIIRVGDNIRAQIARLEKVIQEEKEAKEKAELDRQKQNKLDKEADKNNVDKIYRFNVNKKGHIL